MDIFTRTIHGIRLKYAAVCVAFLAVAVLLFHLGGPDAFGWHDFFAILVLVLMVLSLFLLQCHFVIAPIERMAAAVSEQREKAAGSADPARIEWNGKDEFACLAASLNGLLEDVQNRSLRFREENRRLKNIVASAEVELVVMSGKGALLDVVHCPPGMEPVPGLVRGCPPDPFVWSAENRRAFQAALASAVAGGGLRTADLSFPMAGPRKTRRIKAFVRRTDADAFPVVVFREEAAAAPVAPAHERKVPLARIAAGISRDLRNVFSVIRDSAERYAGSEKPEVRETVARINDAIRSGTEMMENLLTLGGEMHMNLRSVSVRALVEEMKPTVGGLARAGGVRVEYDVSDGERRLMADLRQLAKVFDIVVRNSVEAFGEIPGRIVLSTKAVGLTEEEGALFSPRLAAGGGVLIRIEDDGPGMPANILESAFEPYCTTKANGRGLGLSIADSIVASHGGGMRIDSSRSAHTGVEIFLPASSRASEDVERLLREFPGGEVLVVDDNRSVLKITSALLRTQKIAAHVADCRADALRKYGELAGRIRAVFLDAQLGSETSVGILQNMRDIDATIPIVVVSGYTKGEIDALFFEAPPDGYLMKPYTVSELQAVLEKV